MIKMKPYSEMFEKEYYQKIKNFIGLNDRNDIIDSCKKYFPSNFFTQADIDQFENLIISPYKKIKEAYEYIDKYTKNQMKTECFNNNEQMIPLYETLHNTYEKVRDCKIKKIKMNVRIVKESEILTCPYCNRDYINCRGDNSAGAQLDHFYSRSKYPIFSLCLYNLIPTCGNCNRIKSDNDDKIISPFDSSIDFNENIKFSYIPSVNGMPKVIINANGPLKKNVDVMKIMQAYEIHNTDVEELIYKTLVYNKTQKAEIINMFKEKNVEIREDEIKRIIFGNIKTNEFGKKALSKFNYDILKELKIYN